MYNEKLIGITFNSFSSIFGYLFTIRLGKTQTIFKIQTNKEKNNNINKLPVSIQNMNFNFYSKFEPSDIELKCKCKWSLYLQDNEIINIDNTDHNESETILDVILTVYKITSFTYENEILLIKFDNDFILKLSKSEEDDYIFIHDYRANEKYSMFEQKYF